MYREGFVLEQEEKKNCLSDVWMEARQDEGEHKKTGAKYQWIPTQSRVQNVTEAYPNPKSNKKSKGQNYLEFQLHVNVSCIF